jgi:hypothetical protein
MALPTSGPLTLADIQTEFGGSNPISLSEYYAGGTYVPAGTSGTYGAVPSSGTISIQNFYGTSNVDVSITNQSIFFNTVSPLDAYARYQLDSDGKVYKFTGKAAGTPTTYIEDWVDPNSEASNYECFATVSGDALQTGTTGSWLALTSDRMWGIAETGAGTKFTTLTVTIREVGTTTNLTSATISMFVSTA